MLTITFIFNDETKSYASVVLSKTSAQEATMSAFQNLLFISTVKTVFIISHFLMKSV